MTIPLPVLMTAVSLIRREVDARGRRLESEGQRASRIAELDHDRERLRLELEAADRKAEREKAVILDLLERAQAVQQMKIDAIVSIFRDTKGLLEGHQRALADEKSGLNQKLVETELTAQSHLMILRRQREIDQLLNKVDDNITGLADECVSVIADLHPQLGLSHIERAVSGGLLQLTSHPS